MSSYLIAGYLHENCVAKLIVDLSHLRSPPFTVFTTACFIGYLGLYTGIVPPFSLPSVSMMYWIFTVLTYIGTAAQSYGISASDAYTLVSIANAASFIGRLSTGYLADKHVTSLALFMERTNDIAVDMVP